MHDHFSHQRGPRFWLLPRNLDSLIQCWGAALLSEPMANILDCFSLNALVSGDNSDVERINSGTFIRLKCRTNTDEPKPIEVERVSRERKTAGRAECSDVTGVKVALVLVSDCMRSISS